MLNNCSCAAMMSVFMMSFSLLLSSHYYVMLPSILFSLQQIGAASVVMWALYQSVKRELSQKTELSIYRSIEAPSLIYVLELWAVTEKNGIAVTSG